MHITEGFRPAAHPAAWAAVSAPFVVAGGAIRLRRIIAERPQARLLTPLGGTAGGTTGWASPRGDDGVIFENARTPRDVANLP